MGSWLKVKVLYSLLLHLVFPSALFRKVKLVFQDLLVEERYGDSKDSDAGAVVVKSD